MRERDQAGKYEESVREGDQAGRVRSGQVRSGQARPGQARSGQARPGQARSGGSRMLLCALYSLGPGLHTHPSMQLTSASS